MTERTEQHLSLLRDLLEAYTAHHQALNVTVREMPGKVQWIIVPHLDDQKKLVGTGGSHIKALKFLWSQVGRTLNVVYAVDLLESVEGAVNAVWPARPWTPEVQDFLRDLLNELLEELDIEAGVSESEGATPWEICCAGPAAYKQLLHPHPNHRESFTVMGALTLLFMACGNRHGTELVLTVRE